MNAPFLPIQPFQPYLTRWGLTPVGEPITTHSSRLLPVRRNRDGVRAILKIAHDAEEKFGGGLMPWWAGEGAAPVLEHDEDDGTLLLLQAEGTRSLADLSRSGPDGDAEATRILCRAVARLHAPRSRPAPALIPLTEWFRELAPAAATHGGILVRCAAAAGELLASQRDIAALHGDIHHGNVLDFGGGPDDWRVIDPKRLQGERAFDYANLFCNPDRETASAPGAMTRRVAIVTGESGLERTRLLQWILAWAGLSAAWSLGDGLNADTALSVAETAAAELVR